MAGGSLLGRIAAAAQSSTPVPAGARPTTGTFTSLMLASADEANMRAYTSHGTVHSNVSLLASSTAKPEWRLYRKQEDGRVRYSTSSQGSDQRPEVIQHQALAVLNKPAAITAGGRETVFWTRQQLFEISGIWLETTGKSHWVVNYAGNSGIPAGLWPVPPNRMEPIPDPDKYLAGWLYTSPDGREKIPLPVDEVIYNRYPDPNDVYGGAGPVESVLTNIEAARYASEWNKNFFLNSARPDGVIELDPTVEDVDFEAMEDRWRQAHRGVSRAHRVAVLEAGAKWVPTSTSPKDMDFAKLTVEMRDEIREALGMHKVMTGVTDDVNRANAQTGEEVFANWKIVPRLDRWKDVLNYQFLPLFGATGQGVEFDYIYPLPQNREQDNAELTAKATAAQLLVGAGWDPDDVLEVVGLPAMDFSGPAEAPDTPSATAALGGETASESGAGADDGAQMAARLRKVLSNGRLPVEMAGVN